MCYAIPGKVTAIKGKIITVEYFGELRKAKNLTYDLSPGEYVYAQGGLVVGKIDEHEALEILGMWKQQFARLKQIDADISGGELGDDALSTILRKAEISGTLNRNEMRSILSLSDGNAIDRLSGFANTVRRDRLDNACCVHGILEFSNFCQCTCRYCGIRAGNDSLRRYRMSEGEILSSIDFAVNELGFKAMVLQSGEDSGFSDDDLVWLVKRIREKHGILLFMSVGERSKECYERLFEAGAYGALLRFETSNPEIYSKMRPGKRLEGRLDLIKWMKKRGFVLATGFMVGLPGQSDDDIIDDILLTRSINPDMYSFGPFIPHPKTALSSTRSPSVDYVLKVISLSRLVDPESRILITTALEILSGDARKRGLLAGGNSLMINTTPGEYSKRYDLYPGKTDSYDVKNEIKDIVGLLKSIGRAPTDLGI